MAAGAVTRPLTVVVLIDALGWSYVRNSDFLADILPHRQALRTVLGFSSGAIPTLLTGKPPVETGHWNLFYYDPAHSPFRWLRPFRALPSPLLDNRYARAILKRIGRRWLGLGPLFECSVRPSLLPWFNFVEKKDIYAPEGITGAASIFDGLRRKGVPYQTYSYRQGTDAELLCQAKADFASGDSSFFFVYLCEMDSFLHGHCADPHQVQARLSWYEKQLRDLVGAARQADEHAVIAVVSDHGMAPITSHYDLVKDIDGLGLRTPDDYLAVYDSTMARFWFFTAAARQAIENVLQRVRCGHLLADDELHNLGIFFADRRYGEAVFLLDPGCIVAESDFNGSSWRPVGMHGYHPDDPNSDAIFLCNLPPAVPLRSIADVCPWMEETLGLRA